MKKELLTLSLLISTGFAFSQVGINTPEPKATFDVKAKETNATTAEGIIAPRLSGDEIQAKDAKYSSDQTGTLIYATSATTTPAGKTINITAAGYYYFDGSKWNRFTNTSAKNGLISDADFVKLGGMLTEPTTLSTSGDNNLVIQANGIGGVTSEANQGLNVLATATTNSANAIALRGRILQTAGTVVQLRGITGVSTLTGGTVAGSSNGGYFNNQLNGGALGTGAVMSAVSGDVEAVSGNANQTNVMIGGRFGSAVSGSVSSGLAVGVLATAGGSTTSNIGSLSVINDPTLANVGAASLAVGGAGNGAAIVAINPTTTANNYAIYSDGNVAMKNLSNGLASSSLLVIDGAGEVKKIAGSDIIEAAGADSTNDAWVNVAGPEARVELGTLANGTTARPAGTEFVALDNGNVGIGTSTPSSALQVTGGASPLEWGMAVSNTVADNAIKYGYVKSPAFNTANPPLMGLVMKSTATESRLEVGGLSSTHSAPTDITFVTDNDNNLSTPLGTVRARIDGNGNFSIGNDATVNNPTNRLHVQATADPVRLEGLQTGAITDNLVVADATGVLKTVESATLAVEPWNIAATTNKANANTDNIYQMGKVGIGTSTPTAALQVTGGASPLEWGMAVSNTVADNTIKYGYVKSPAFNTANPPLMGLVMKSTATESRLEVGGLSSTHSAPTDITFVTDNDNNLSTPLGTVRARIDGNGNFSIGNDATVNNPTNRLHVQATANPLRLEGLQAGAVTDNYLTVDADGVVRTSSSSATANSWNKTGNAGTDPAADFIGTTDAIDFVIKTAGTERLKVTAAGNMDLPNSTTATGIITKGNTSFLHNRGIFNTALGKSALNSASLTTTSGTNGTRNVAIGQNSMRDNTDGYYNTALGFDALKFNTTGLANVAIGTFTMAQGTSSNNTAMGWNTLPNNTGSVNTAIGYNALGASDGNSIYFTQTGGQNVAIGGKSMRGNSSGSGNVAMGYQAMMSSLASKNGGSTGNNNVAIGLNALSTVTSGSENVIIGNNAGNGTNTSSNNVQVGTSTRAGESSNTTLLGFGARVTGNNTYTNATAIGSKAEVNASNSLVLGGTGANAVNVGIGSTAPTSKLQVVGISAYANDAAAGAAGLTTGAFWQTSAGNSLGLPAGVLMVKQ